MIGTQMPHSLIITRGCKSWNKIKYPPQHPLTLEHSSVYLPDLWIFLNSNQKGNWNAETYICVYRNTSYNAIHSNYFVPLLCTYIHIHVFKYLQNLAPETPQILVIFINNICGWNSLHSNHRLYNILQPTYQVSGFSGAQFKRGVKMKKGIILIYILTESFCVCLFVCPHKTGGLWQPQGQRFCWP